MKLILTIVILLTSIASSQAQAPLVVTSDIDNFLQAYDKITATTNTGEQYKLINTLFIERGTPGLKAIMEVRNYNDTSYIEAINKYPLFWQSVRVNTLKASQFAKAIGDDVAKIKTLYPALKPATIYFTIGALRTNGTTLEKSVLIGSELALGDSSTIVTELPANFSHLTPFFKSNPVKDVVFLNVHEYVHTQQKTTIGDNLLVQCIIEGVAEFVTVTATGKQSPAACIAYGKLNNDKVRTVFEQHLFNPFEGFWLYSNADNEFNMRDLGYYIGYAICEAYYNKMPDKKAAIRNMIELDYNNEAVLLKFADKSGYFSKPLADLKTDYEKSRPTVVTYTIENKTGSTPTLAITFSEKMNDCFRNFDYGPLGEDHVLRITKFTGWSADGKTVSFQIILSPGQHYQLLVGGGFRNGKGVSLKPFLIDEVTGN